MLDIPKDCNSLSGVINEYSKICTEHVKVLQIHLQEFHCLVLAASAFLPANKDLDDLICNLAQMRTYAEELYIKIARLPLSYSSSEK